MKFSPCRVRTVAPVAIAVTLLLLALSGCGRSASRPASSLSEKDRTVLTKYETIRAALVVDDLRAAKRAATDLGTFLKPTPESAGTPLDTPVQEIATAAALDKARVAFKTLSASMVTLADGVEGYYVMESPVPNEALWVQTTPKVDNPYVGSDRPVFTYPAERCANVCGVGAFGGNGWLILPPFGDCCRSAVYVLPQSLKSENVILSRRITYTQSMFLGTTPAK